MEGGGMAITAQQLELITKAYDSIMMAEADLVDLEKVADPVLKTSLVETRKDVERTIRRLSSLKEAMYVEAL
jgi:hypothetical protein